MVKMVSFVFVFLHTLEVRIRHSQGTREVRMALKITLSSFGPSGSYCPGSPILPFASGIFSSFSALKKTQSVFRLHSLFLPVLPEKSFWLSLLGASTQPCHFLCSEATSGHRYMRTLQRVMRIYILCLDCWLPTLYTLVQAQWTAPLERINFNRQPGKLVSHKICKSWRAIKYFLCLPITQGKVL